MSKRILVVDNVRSAHNVGAIWRSAAAFGLDAIYLVGITPHPKRTADDRPPHVSQRAAELISKTALGAEAQVAWKYFPNLNQAAKQLKSAGYHLLALEQHPEATPLTVFKARLPWALIVGNEVKGVSPEGLTQAEAVLEIVSGGPKESLNVAVATGIALFALTSG